MGGDCNFYRARQRLPASGIVLEAFGQGKFDGLLDTVQGAHRDRAQGTQAGDDLLHQDVGGGRTCGQANALLAIKPTGLQFVGTSPSL